MDMSLVIPFVALQRDVLAAGGVRPVLFPSDNQPVEPLPSSSVVDISTLGRSLAAREEISAAAPALPSGESPNPSTPATSANAPATTPVNAPQPAPEMKAIPVNLFVEPAFSKMQAANYTVAQAVAAYSVASMMERTAYVEDEAQALVDAVQPVGRIDGLPLKLHK